MQEQRQQQETFQWHSEIGTHPAVGAFAALTTALGVSPKAISLLVILSSVLLSIVAAALIYGAVMHERAMNMAHSYQVEMLEHQRSVFSVPK